MADRKFWLPILGVRNQIGFTAGTNLLIHYEVIADHCGRTSTLQECSLWRVRQLREAWFRFCRGYCKEKLAGHACRFLPKNIQRVARPFNIGNCRNGIWPWLFRNCYQILGL